MNTIAKVGIIVGSGALVITIVFLIPSVNEDIQIEMLKTDAEKIRSMTSEEEAVAYIEEIIYRPNIVKTCAKVIEQFWEDSIRVTIDPDSVTQKEVLAYRDEFGICLTLNWLYPEKFPQITDDIIEEKTFNMKVESGLIAPDCKDKFAELKEKKDRSLKLERQLEFDLDFPEESVNEWSEELSQLKKDLQKIGNYVNANCYP